MNNYIKSLLTTRGWAEAEKMFVAEILVCRNDVVDEGMDSDSYKATVIGNRKAADRMQGLLNKIKLAGGGNQVEKISYK